VSPSSLAQVELLFDGGSRGNPGPAYGSYRLKLPGRPDGLLRRRTFGRMTNNEAEYATLIAGLEDLTGQLAHEGILEAGVRLEIRGDSQLVIEQLTGAWRVRNPRLRILWERARELLACYGAVSYSRIPRWRVVAVLGH